MTEAVVFDFAGVLFRWRPAAMVARLLPRRAPDEVSAERLVCEIFQGYGGDWAAFDRGSVEVDALVARIAARTGLPAHELRAVVDEVPRELEPVAEVVAIVEALHAAGRRLFFLSNMPAPYADHLERAHSFLRRFEDGVFSARVRRVKPEPGIFELAAARFGVAPAGLLFFDDVAANVEAARSAGWSARPFTGAGPCRLELRAAGVL